MSNSATRWMTQWIHLRFVLSRLEANDGIELRTPKDQDTIISTVWSSISQESIDRACSEQQCLLITLPLHMPGQAQAVFDILAQRLGPGCRFIVRSGGFYLHSQVALPHAQELKRKYKARPKKSLADDRHLGDVCSANPNQ